MIPPRRTWFVPDPSEEEVRKKIAAGERRGWLCTARIPAFNGVYLFFTSKTPNPK